MGKFSVLNEEDYVVQIGAILTQNISPQTGDSSADLCVVISNFARMVKVMGDGGNQEIATISCRDCFSVERVFEALVANPQDMAWVAEIVVAITITPLTKE